MTRPSPDRVAWLSRIVADASLPPVAKRIAVALVGSFGSAPSVAELAEMAGRCRRHARRGVRALEAAGHLHVERGCGRGVTSVYYMIRPAAQPAGRQAHGRRAIHARVGGAS